MEKSKINLKLCGMDCAIISDDKQEYMESLAEEINEKVKSIEEKSPQVSTLMSMALTTLEYCDLSKKIIIKMEKEKEEKNQFFENLKSAKLELKKILEKNS